ncbi:MAG TPA: PqqD family protein [Acidimicrobiales bacterium]|nr:PqqD family protein [Acidimicrobiales bacterium]
MLSDRPQVEPGLEVNEVRDGLTVFDSVADRIHYLNQTAAIVFTLCDGRRSVSDMAAFLAEAFKLEEPPLNEVQECVGQLVRLGLIR